MGLIAVGLLYGMVLNLLTVGAFWLDKRRARHHLHRIPEAQLLFLAAVGGWPCAKVAQRFFRHKTSKQPFGMILNFIGIVWACAAVWGALAFT